MRNPKDALRDYKRGLIGPDELYYWLAGYTIEYDVEIEKGIALVVTIQTLPDNLGKNFMCQRPNGTKIDVLPHEIVRVTDDEVKELPNV